MASGQVIRLVNEGDSDFRDMYGSQPYVIPAGGQMFVDYDAMCLWLGHPEANDFDPRNRVRLAEYQRLRGRYGVDAKSLEQTLANVPTDSDELFRRMRPKLAAYDASTNTQIITVADDPDGMTVNREPEPGDNQGLILARMQQMEQEMAGLRTQLAQQERSRQALDDATPITNDNPDLADMSAGPPMGHNPGIPGTVITSPDNADSAPRPEPRQSPGEDSPSRVRISG